MTITKDDGRVVFDGSFDAATSGYLRAKFSATSGEHFSIAITDANANAQGGFYRISAGPPVASAVEQGSQVFLPLIER